MVREYLRAVIWPRQPMTAPGKPTNYRYNIVGFIVTDTPLEGIEGEVEVVLDGQTFGLSDVFDSMEKRENAGCSPFGDATDVLLSLADEQGFESQPKTVAVTRRGDGKCVKRKS